MAAGRAAMRPLLRSLRRGRLLRSHRLSTLSDGGSREGDLFFRSHEYSDDHLPHFADPVLEDDMFMEPSPGELMDSAASTSRVGQYLGLDVLGNPIVLAFERCAEADQATGNGAVSLTSSRCACLCRSRRCSFTVEW